MSIPDYQTLMAPVLHAVSDGQPSPLPEIRARVADRLGLSDHDLRELVPSGQKPLFHDRVSWAVSYLKQAEVLDRPKRGVYALSPRGQEVLEAHPDRVDNEFLPSSTSSRTSWTGRRRRTTVAIRPRPKRSGAQQPPRSRWRRPTAGSAARSRRSCSTR